MHKRSYTEAQALIEALHDVKPPVLAGGIDIEYSTDGINTIRVKFLMTPEVLIRWGKIQQEIKVKNA